MKGRGNKRRDRSSIDVPRRHPLLDSEKKGICDRRVPSGEYVPNQTIT